MLKVRIVSEPDGCEKIIKLEHLKNHQTNCEYSPNLIVCDKGCNLTVKRCEYQLDCIEHLADRSRSQDEKFCSIVYALNDHQCQEMITLNAEVNHLQAQVSKLSRNLISQQKLITKLNGEIKRIRPDDDDAIRKQSNTPIRIPQWQKSFNVKTSTDQPNILNFGHNPGSAFAQSLHPLNKENRCFKTQLLSNCGHDSIAICIGLTQKCHPIDIPPGHSDGSIGYRCCGTLYYDKCESISSTACKVNDIIECGIKFSKNFFNDGCHSVLVYFSRNGKAFMKKVIRMPVDGLFPTIFMFDIHLGCTVTIKYFGL